MCIACSSGTFMKGNMKNLGQSFKKWKLFHYMNRISQYLDVASLTDAGSENIPDLETIPKKQKF